MLKDWQEKLANILWMILMMDYKVWLHDSLSRIVINITLFIKGLDPFLFFFSLFFLKLAAGVFYFLII